MKTFVAGPVAATLLLVLIVPACSSEDDEDDVRVGVNDVRKACDVRATWKAPDSPDCATCQTSAILNRCECETLREFSGACIEAADRVRAEATCTRQIDDCARACAPTDCACVEGCYAGADACKRVAAGRDGCVAEVCASHCGGS